MAYDFIKALLPQEKIKEVKEHPLLDFMTDVSTTTGELPLKEEVARYKGLNFTIRKNRIWLSGSLHSFYNIYFKGENQNYDDFTLEKVRIILDKIESLFNLDLSKCKLENIEIGVNICLPFKTYLILLNLLFHNTKRFRDQQLRNGKGDYKNVIHDRFTLKFYDKSLQFNLPYELMRFEIHFNKMTELKQYGIIYLSDLNDKTKLEYLKHELLKRFDEVFLYDWTIQEDSIKRKPKGFYNWKLWHYWVNDLNKNNRNKRKEAYRKIVSNYSDKVKEQIRVLIEQKIDELTNTKGDLFTVGRRKEKKRLFHSLVKV